jgi:hypothetical protein
MPEQLHLAPQEEQDICVICGLCCDGTLFLHACLNPGERGKLPEKIEQNSFTEDGRDYFRLPCNYFSEKCIIYNGKRADVCSSYRCQLLKDFSEGKVTPEEARGIVSKAMKMREEIIEYYKSLSGNKEEINFRRILNELGMMQNEPAEGNMDRSGYDILLARCNIFEALLIKHLRSASDFEKMVMSEKDIV